MIEPKITYTNVPTRIWYSYDSETGEMTFHTSRREARNARDRVKTRSLEAGRQPSVQVGYYTATVDDRS